MNENAERINGWAAMIGVIAAMGSYATTGQIIPESGERHVTHGSIPHRWVYICRPIDGGRC